MNETVLHYIIECSDGAYYTGITNNLERRLLEHNQGINDQCYTYRRRPVILQFCQCFTDARQAIEFEKQIKGWSRAKKRALIEQPIERLKELSKGNN